LHIDRTANDVLKSEFLSDLLNINPG